MAAWTSVQSIGARDAGSGGYSRIVSIDVRHGFHNRADGDRTPGPCTDVAIAPTERTAERLARYGLLVRRRPDGIDILATGAQADALADAVEAIAAAPGDLMEGVRRLLEPPLVFTVSLRDPAFLNVTALPPGAGRGQACLLFSNRGNQAAAPAAGEATFPLPASLAWEDASRDADDPKPRQAALEAASRRAGLSGAAMLYEPSASVLAGEEERRALLSDLGGSPFGLVEVHLVAPEDAPGGGLYPVQARAEAPASPGAAGRGHVTPVRYTIAFEPRRTQWRYVVVDSRGALEADSLAVRDDARPHISFAREAGPAVPGAASVTALTSDEALPFLEHPPSHFRLDGRTRKGGRNARPLLDPLPAAARDGNAAPAPGGGELSTIYVYL